MNQQRRVREYERQERTRSKLEAKSEKRRAKRRQAADKTPKSLRETSHSPEGCVP
jgi:hypothetical protein